MRRNFEEWFSHFKGNISDYQYYVDFNKAIQNVSEIKVELDILNSLLGSKNIENDFRSLIIKYPKIIKYIPILLAVRNYEIYLSGKYKENLISFLDIRNSIEEYIDFMKNIGLFDIFQKNLIKNLWDYVLGVEVGLDSHSRKNRAGITMERLVEKYIIDSGFIKNKTYFKSINLVDLVQKLGIQINSKNLKNKQFDFVLIDRNKILFAIEANFFSSLGGSKLNEIARSYKMLSSEIKKISGIKFIWITDGKGWQNSKNF